MNRRRFLGAILAASAAPAFVKAGTLMPIWVPRAVWPAPPEELLLWGDGIHDDTAALQAALNGSRVRRAAGGWLGQEDGALYIQGGNYVLSKTLLVPSRVQLRDAGFRMKGGNGPLLTFMGGSSGSGIESCSFRF